MSYNAPDDSTSWATIDDLYDRYGDEYVDKLAIRRRRTAGGDYVADQSDEAITRVLILALSDAKDHLQFKLNGRFSNANQINSVSFPIIKAWHIRLTIATLLNGGDCQGCTCLGLDEFLQGEICSPEGICLSSSKTFFSFSEAKFSCECVSSCCCNSPINKGYA